MPARLFLKLSNNIDGESEAKDHKGEIEINSFNWGGCTDIMPTSGHFFVPSGSKKFVISDIQFTMKTNKASAAILQHCITGKKINNATLTCRRFDKKHSGNDFLIISMENIFVNNYQMGGTHNRDVPLDTFSINFEKIEFEYTVIKEHGKEGEQTTVDIVQPPGPSGPSKPSESFGLLGNMGLS